MVGSLVHHPLFGRGRVKELRNAGREAAVQFDSGIRTVVPASMLTTLETSPAVAAPRPQPMAVRPELTPDQRQQFAARRTIEALRYGIVPQKRIREMSVGLERPLNSLHEAFEQVQREGGDLRVVVGEYGSGKSHFFEIAAQDALERRYLVAVTSLDIQEVPPNRPQRIYNSLIKSLHLPDQPDERGLVPLLEAVCSRPAVMAAMLEKLRGTIFATVIQNYSQLRSKDGEELQLLLDWISGEKVYISDIRKVLPVRNQDFPAPALSTMTTTADQYCYLLSGWGWVASQLGYAGLVLLIDESEHYSLLPQRGKERADNMFKGLIYTCTAGQPNSRITENDLEHHHANQHSFRLMEHSHLLTLFAMTPTVNAFDYRRWLQPEQIITLESRWDEGTIEELMSRLYVLHRQAYGYERSDILLDVAHGLLECLESRLINLRQTIRLTMEIYDRCFAYPDFAATQAVDEVRRALLGR